MKRFKLRIDGPGGKIETVINDPIEDRKGVAFIAHPHPLHGGTMDNKVVQTLAETLVQLGYVAVRPNFRGVGMSEGDYDHGTGEVEDMLATVRFVQGHYPDLPILLAGFSFGAYVQAQVCRRLPCRQLVLVGPAVNMFEFGDVPLGTHIIHGEKDELVPLAWVEAWANQYEAKLTVIKGTDHFFNRKLTQLKQAVMESCQS
jgi:alpha/beta superfamily hydrolase